VNRVGLYEGLRPSTNVHQPLGGVNGHGPFTEHRGLGAMGTGLAKTALQGILDTDFPGHEHDRNSDDTPRSNSFPTDLQLGAGATSLSSSSSSLSESDGALHCLVTRGYGIS